MQSKDEMYMKRCFELAKRALGNTYPNPLVGAVIVYQDRIIGEGFHHQAGQPHAEVNAIRMVADTTLLKSSTLYVNLEPCAHFGKTPPCADLIISCGIPRVVISNLDPFEKVAGKGIERMNAAGIIVETGVLQMQGEQLNKRFFTFIQNKRPYVVLKWAQSRDGFMDISREQGQLGSFQITGIESRRLVHKWRTEEQAILVGYNTIVNDNPLLNARLFSGKSPIKVILDPKAKLTTNHHFFTEDPKSIVISDEQHKTATNDLPFRVFTDLTKDSVKAILDVLYENNIHSVLVEGGAFTLQQFISASLWDEVRLFTGNIFMVKGMPSPSLSRTPSKTETVGVDQLDTFYA